MKEITTTNNEVQPIEVNTITEYLDATGLTKKLLPNEKTMFINIAQSFGLNPFKREIYCNVYGEGQYRQCSIITGYEVYLKRADRLNKLNGWETALNGSVKDGTLSATVTIYRKDWEHPFKHTVYYREVVQTKKDGTPNRFWQTQPSFMTRKVAIAQAFRLCFPDEFGGMPYTNDELGVEQSAPIVERNITAEATAETHEEPPITQEQPTQTTAEEPNDENRRRLGTLLKKHGKDITEKVFTMCQKAIMEGDEAEVCDKLDRLVIYLGKKGIKE